MRSLLVIHGPNLNLLGKRAPEIYGNATLDDVNREIRKFAFDHGVEVKIAQHNHEGAIIDEIHAGAGTLGIVINPGGYTHTSVAIRDAIEAVGVPAIEVHLSNIQGREAFRRDSLIAPVCVGQISGLGWRGYVLAMTYLLDSAA